MYVSNELDFGHLVNPETYDISRTNPDMYQLFDNKMEWTTRYLHEEYHLNFDEERKHLMVCIVIVINDINCFPLCIS